jgi:hypothetical protein
LGLIGPVDSIDYYNGTWCSVTGRKDGFPSAAGNAAT